MLVSRGESYELLLCSSRGESYLSIIILINANKFLAQREYLNLFMHIFVSRGESPLLLIIYMFLAWREQINFIHLQEYLKCVTHCIVDNNVAFFFCCVIVKFLVTLEFAVILEPYARMCCCLPGQMLTWAAAVLWGGSKFQGKNFTMWFSPQGNLYIVAQAQYILQAQQN